MCVSQVDRTSADNIEPPKVIKSNISPIVSANNLLNVPNESNHDMISQASGFSALSKQVALNQFGKSFGGIQNMMMLGSKKLRLSPSKLGAPQIQENKLQEGFQSKLKMVKVLSEKHDIGEATFLNVE